MPAPRVQLLLYGFGPDAAFEGRLVGALERIETGGALRILDVLFVTKDAETGEIAVVELHGGTGGVTAPLLGFRLDPAGRRRATERALSDDGRGVPAATLRDLADSLEPGHALAAVLVEHVWARALDDAASRTGGGPLVDDLVEAGTLAEVAPDLLAAAGRA